MRAALHYTSSMMTQLHEHRPEHMSYRVFFFWNAIMFRHDCIHCNQKISTDAKYKIYSWLVLALFTTVFLVLRKCFNGLHNIESIATLIVLYFGYVSVNYLIFQRATFHTVKKNSVDS
jgi:hypothetical protein